MDAILEPGTESIDHGETGLARYLKEVGRSRLLDRSQERRLLERARRGDRKALNDLVTANLKWVVAVSAEYAGSGMPMPDLIAEGNLGLIRAVIRFDPVHGGRFSSFALWWIRQGLERALADQTREAGDRGRSQPISAAAGEASRGAAPDAPRSDGLRRALEDVREPARTVLKLYFGFDAPGPLSLDRIAHHLGIPPRRAYRLKELALRRLQSVLSEPRRA